LLLMPLQWPPKEPFVPLNFYRASALFRFIVGAVLVLFMWISYAVRMIWGVGLMRDHHGDPAPPSHYLVGAVTITGIVAVWIGAREWWERR
jgi:hypothetical protein